MRLRSGATNKLIVRRIDVDDGVPGQELANGGGLCGSPAEGHDGLRHQCIRDGLGFQRTKSAFAVGREDVCDRTARTFDDERIRVDVCDAETIG